MYYSFQPTTLLKTLFLPTTCSDQSDQTVCNIPVFFTGLRLLQYYKSNVFSFYSKHSGFNGLVKRIDEMVKWSGKSVDEMGKCSRTKRECDSLESCLSSFSGGLNWGH